MGSAVEWEQIVPEAVVLDGDRVVFRTAGEGPVLLLVHGMAGSAATWKRVFGLLSRRFTVVAPDLLGHGDSDRPPCEYSLGTHANTLRDLMDVLGHQRATVIGQSFGGGVALQLAYQFPERCERLVLVDSGGLGPDVNIILRLLSLPGAGAVLALGAAPAARAVARRVGTWLGRAGLRLTRAGEEIWRSYASLGDADSRRALFRCLHDVIDWSGQTLCALRHRAPTLRMPVLIVWGADDPFIPVSHAHAAHLAIPGSRLVVFEGVTHYPHCQVPERFVEAVVDFVHSTQPARLPVRSTPCRDRERRPGRATASSSATRARIVRADR